MRENLRGLRLIFSAGFQASPRMAIFGFFLEPVGSGLQILNGLFIKWVVDGVRAGDPMMIRRAAIGLAVVMVSAQVMAAIGWRLRTKLLERTGAWLDARLLELEAALPGLEHTERAEYHDRVQAISGHNLSSSIMGIVGFFASAIRLVIGTGLLATLHPVLIALPLFGLPSLFLGMRAQAIQHDAWEANASRFRRSNAFYALTINASPAKELRVFGLHDRISRIHRTEREAANVALRAADWRGAVLTMVGWACFAVSYVGALALVAVRARRGEATIGDVMLAITIAAQLNRSVADVVEEVQWTFGRLRTAKHFLWFEDLARAAGRGADVALPERLTDGIRFEDVSFVYPGTDAPVLENVTLRLPAGARVAIVGDNGAGKTTLVKLLCGFYRPTSGRITVDDVDLADVDPVAWRRHVAAGFQDYCRFELRARETVGVGDLPHMEDEQSVTTALARAGASDVPAKMPAGLDTQLGKSFDEGVDLSMGQWQKLALGRAFMRARPLLLILDEPTSSLDAPTEQALFSRYAAVAEERRADGAITLLVSHRFSTVRTADLIVVVEGGQIREVGSHEELIARAGLYAELFTLQASAYR